MICQEEQSCDDAFIPASPAAAAAAVIMEHSFDSALPSLNDHHLSFSQGLSSSDDESFQGKESKENGPHNKDVKKDPGRWTPEEHMLFLKGLQIHGKSWKKISEIVKTRTVVQIRTHAQKYLIKLEKAKKAGHRGVLMMDGKGVDNSERRGASSSKKSAAAGGATKPVSSPSPSQTGGKKTLQRLAEPAADHVPEHDQQLQQLQTQQWQREPLGDTFAGASSSNILPTTTTTTATATSATITGPEVGAPTNIAHTATAAYSMGVPAGASVQWFPAPLYAMHFSQPQRYIHTSGSGLEFGFRVLSPSSQARIGFLPAGNPHLQQLQLPQHHAGGNMEQEQQQQEQQQQHQQQQPPHQQHLAPAPAEWGHGMVNPAAASGYKLLSPTMQNGLRLPLDEAFVGFHHMGGAPYEENMQQHYKQQRLVPGLVAAAAGAAGAHATVSLDPSFFRPAFVMPQQLAACSSASTTSSVGSPSGPQGGSDPLEELMQSLSKGQLSASFSSASTVGQEVDDMPSMHDLNVWELSEKNAHPSSLRSWDEEDFDRMSSFSSSPHKDGAHSSSVSASAPSVCSASSLSDLQHVPAA